MGKEDVWTVISSVQEAARVVPGTKKQLVLLKETLRCQNGSTKTRYVLHHPFAGPTEVSRVVGMLAIERLGQEELF